MKPLYIGYSTLQNNGSYQLSRQETDNGYLGLLNGIVISYVDNNIISDGSGVLNDNEVYFKRRIERIIERGNINGYCDYESVAKLYNNKNTYTIQNYNHWADSLDKLVEHDKLVFQSVTQDSYIPIMDSITLPAITDNGNVTFNISDFNSSYDEGNLNALNHYKR